MNKWYKANNDAVFVTAPEEFEIVFAQAKALLAPYFVAKDPSSAATDTKEAANAEVPESSSNHVALRYML